MSIVGRGDNGDKLRGNRTRSDRSTAWEIGTSWRDRIYHVSVNWYINPQFNYSSTFAAES